MKYFTPEEVAEQLRVKRETVYTWLRKGKLKGMKFGDLWRIDEADLQKFIEEAKKKPENK